MEKSHSAAPASHVREATECPQEMLRAMKLDTASSPDEALEKAFAHCGKNAKVAVIPEGVSVIPVKK